MFNYSKCKLIYLTAILFLSGCSLLKSIEDKNCSVDESQALSTINLQYITDKLAYEICGSDMENISFYKPDEIIIVPDFVEIKSLKPEIHGLIIGEKFRASISRICKVPIRQVELYRDFKLNSDGLMVLTRNADSIRDPKALARNALVGTFNIQNNKLSLIAKKISIENSTIVGMSTKEINWECKVSASGNENLSWIVK